MIVVMLDKILCVRIPFGLIEIKVQKTIGRLVGLPGLRRHADINLDHFYLAPGYA